VVTVLVLQMDFFEPLKSVFAKGQRRFLWSGRLAVGPCCSFKQQDIALSLCFIYGNIFDSLMNRACFPHIYSVLGIGNEPEHCEQSRITI